MNAFVALFGRCVLVLELMVRWLQRMIKHGGERDNLSASLVKANICSENISTYELPE